MSYRKKTMRKMYPVSRKLAKLENQLDGISRKIKNLIPQVETLEFKARALDHAKGKKTPEEVKHEGSLGAYIA